VTGANRTTDASRPTGASHRRAEDLRYWLASHRGPMLAAALFVAMFSLFVTEHPAGASNNVINTAANKGALLALVAMAQTIPVLTSGLDLSVGSVFVLTNCVASTMLTGSPLHIALGVTLVLVIGILCGLLNGLVVVVGRLQPIIATLATGAIYQGIALWLRPAPGGEVDEDFADLVTGSLHDVVPFSLVVLLVAVVAVWLPYRHSVLGRAAYAVGSSQQAAYMSGVPVARAKLVAYVLAGFFAAIAGLLLTCLTYSGEANALLGGTYTLSSIAAVVVGGTSLYGGSGGAVGSIIGAFVLRTIGDLLFVFDMDPLSQPLFLGVVLLIAVSLGSFRLLKVKKRVDLYR
jgi:ribose transport system permease protein